ncbi:sigma-E factor negative regulatory protein [Marichromatium bheemlicum]|uniref:Sigma-E factor negative regulatory protein n=1 Tax=Marichromatium bheemlicum TaxID=365339 RepID=A0ABX1IAV2_9GAMM|nr:sigma-E factor negative regulatory protein [Marichromatium bheemlicum]NKN33315.1 sigma-E factor negative regulatory protein [Marichromatium bheemlicum]
MTELRQRLSELQDGELDTASTGRLLDALAHDDELRDTWARYQMIGHAIRGERIDPPHAEVADAVRERVMADALVFHQRHRFQPRRALAPVAGMALAATAAFVAVFAVPPLFFQGGDHLEGGFPTTAQHQPVSPPPTMVTTVGDGRWGIDRPDLANKLDLFLVTHQDTASVSGAKGMLPYATFVGYESPR